MISTAWRFIYLHAPKTGGNAVQLLLQPFSDDALFRVAKEGIRAQRFDVRGPLTPRKHATLQDYSNALDGRLEGWRVAIGVRDPMARAVSHYFSPHRWTGNDEAGAGPPVWRRGRFVKMLRQMPLLVDFLTVDGTLRRPDHLIRQEHLAADVAAFAKAIGLPLDTSALSQVNQSAADADLRQQVMADPVAREAVRARFRADYDLLEALAADKTKVRPPTSAPGPAPRPPLPSSPTST